MTNKEKIFVRKMYNKSGKMCAIYLTVRTFLTLIIDVIIFPIAFVVATFTALYEGIKKYCNDLKEFVIDNTNYYMNKIYEIRMCWGNRFPKQKVAKTDS